MDMLFGVDPWTLMDLLCVDDGCANLTRAGCPAVPKRATVQVA